MKDNIPENKSKWVKFQIYESHRDLEHSLTYKTSLYNWIQINNQPNVKHVPKTILIKIFHAHAFFALEQ